MSISSRVGVPVEVDDYLGDRHVGPHGPTSCSISNLDGSHITDTEGEDLDSGIRETVGMNASSDRGISDETISAHDVGLDLSHVHTDGADSSPPCEFLA